MAYSAVANGGVAFYPRLIKSVIDPEGRPVRRDDGSVVAPPEGRVRADLRRMGISEEGLAKVRRGL